MKDYLKAEKELLERGRSVTRENLAPLTLSKEMSKDQRRRMLFAARDSVRQANYKEQHEVQVQEYQHRHVAF